jgi:TonB family protein
MSPSRAPSRLLIPIVVASMGLCTHAQEAPDTETYIAPRILERKNPLYPAGAQMNGREGWVVLSFVVSVDGTVTEPMIEDSSGSEAFERAALNAIAGWKYSPATQDGQPVEHAMQKTRLTFQLLDNSDGVTPNAMRRFRRISSLLEERKFTEAEPLVAEFEFGERASLYEDAWFWWMKAVYLDGSGSTDEAEVRKSLQRAIGYEEEYLAPTQFVAAARRLFVLDVKAQDVSSAIKTFERLRDAKAARRADIYDETMRLLTPTYDELVQIVGGDNLLVTQARIGEFDYWVHDLVRRTFALGDVSGRLDVLDVRCDRGTKRYNAIPVNAVWRIPESWGECGVYVKGEPGATFVFEEYPASYVAAKPTDVAQSDTAPEQ